MSIRIVESWPLAQPALGKGASPSPLEEGWGEGLAAPQRDHQLDQDPTSSSATRSFPAKKRE